MKKSELKEIIRHCINESHASSEALANDLGKGWEPITGLDSPGADIFLNMESPSWEVKSLNTLIITVMDETAKSGKYTYEMVYNQDVFDTGSAKNLASIKSKLTKILKKDAKSFTGTASGLLSTFK